MGVFLPSEVARLVLGYLEDESCDEAYESFLAASPHLQECRTQGRGATNLGFFYMGFTLANILDDYSAVSSFVLNYYSTKRLRRQISKCHTLLEKVKFLCDNINKAEYQSNDKCDEVVNDGDRKRDSSLAKPEVSPTENISNASRMSIDDSKRTANESDSIKNLSKSIDETSFKRALGLVKHSELEGESSRFKPSAERLKIPKHKGSRSARKYCEGTDALPNESLNVTAITSALLDRTELHEKIAENINNLINRSSFDKTNPEDKSIPGENIPCLTVEDESTQMENVIKSIVEKTEKDPLFDQFLNDVLGNMVQPGTSTDTESDSISRPETSTPEKSAPSMAEDSSPTRINAFNMISEERFHRRKRDYQNRPCDKPTIVTNQSQSSVPVRPRHTYGGKRMDLLKETYKKYASDNSNDGSIESPPANDTPLEVSPTIPGDETSALTLPRLAETTTQAKPEKVKILSNELVKANVTDKGNIVIQKGVTTEISNFKPTQIIETGINPKPIAFVTMPKKINNNESMVNQGVQMPATSHSLSLFSQHSNVQFSGNFHREQNLPVPSNNPPIFPQSQIPTVIIVPSSIVPKVSSSSTNSLSTVSIKSDKPAGPAGFINISNMVNKNTTNNTMIKCHTLPNSIIVFEEASSKLVNSQEIPVADVPPFVANDNLQAALKTPNAPTDNVTNNNSASRKNASHVRVLDFSDRKESSKELIRKALMSPIRKPGSDNIESSPATVTIEQQTNPAFVSPISILNNSNLEDKVQNKGGMSDVWSETLGVNQIIKNEMLKNSPNIKQPSLFPPRSTWDSKLREVIPPLPEKKVHHFKKPTKKKKSSPKKKSNGKGETNQKNDEPENVEDKTKPKSKTKKSQSKKNESDKPAKKTPKRKSTESLLKQTSSSPQTESVQSVESKTNKEPKNDSFETVGDSKVIQIKSTFSMSTFLDTPMKNITEERMNTPKFLNEQNYQSISAIKIDDIPTPFFKKTPITPLTRMISLFGTPGSCDSIPTDYSSSSSYYKPDEIEDVCFYKDDTKNKTIVENTASPPIKTPEIEKENLSDRVLRPRKPKQTKYSEFITEVKKSDLNKSLHSSESESSFIKEEKTVKKPLKSKDVPENRLEKRSFSSPSPDREIKPKTLKISPRQQKQALQEKAERVKSKLNSVKPTILKPPRNALAKIMNKNKTAKQSFLTNDDDKSKKINSKPKTVAEKKVTKKSDNSIPKNRTSDKQTDLVDHPLTIPSKSRRKSSTPRKLEKVDSVESLKTDSPVSQSKVEKDESENADAKNTEEPFPCLSIDMYMSDESKPAILNCSNDSDDDFVEIKNCTNNDSQNKSSLSITVPVEDQIENDLAKIVGSKEDPPPKEIALNESGESANVWSEYNIDKSHTNFINIVSDESSSHEKPAETKEPIGDFVVSIFNTLNDCEEEITIKASGIFNVFEMKPSITEKRKRDESSERWKLKLHRPSDDKSDTPQKVREAELNAAVQSILNTSEVNLREFDSESPQKDKDRENTSDISDSKKALMHIGIDSVLSILHGPDQT